MNDYFAFSRAFHAATTDGLAYDEALGYALAAEYANRPPVVDRDSLLAGMPYSRSLVRLDVNGLSCADTIPDELLGTPYREEARAVLEHWQPRTTATVFARRLAEHGLLDMRQEDSLGWGGGWGGHAILTYTRILSEGISGLQRRIEGKLRDAEQSAAPESARHWYRGLLHVCGGITAYIHRHAACARQLAAEADCAADTAHYTAIADVCDHIATEGARTLREAVQLFWFLHVLDNTDSPGRIDQFLWPYYEQLPGDAEQQRRAAMPVLEAVWQKFIACRSWNVCLGGQTATGDDATNALTYCFLDLQYKFRREAPNLSVRFFQHSPPELLSRCIEVIAQGCGNPALYNDEIIVPALCSLGITVEDARDYAMNGCSQIDIPGRSHMGLEDGELNLAKCLEFALHGGKCAITGRQVGLVTLPVEQIHDYATLCDEYRKQVEFCTSHLVRQANLFQQVIAETGPHLFRSLFFDDCLDTGRDIKRGGPRYNHGQFLTEGIADTADALYALRQVVFTDHRLTLPEMVEVLDADWRDHDALRVMIREQFPKFGNDLDAVDEIAVEIVTHYFAFLRTQSTWRGGQYTGGVSTFNRAATYGRNLSASADGRRCGEIVANSCGPATGRDRLGPTAMLRSVAKLPHHLACSGMVLNVKLTPALFTSTSPDMATQQVAALFRTFFSLGGQQLQVNVIDHATLLAAQAAPAEYQHIIVRVGGYCARFVELDATLQQDIIARTMHAV